VDRLRGIADLVAARGRASLADLECQIAASRATIQRDLIALEQRGLVKRFHGGAMSPGYSGRLNDHGVRKTLNIEAKREIAAKAVRFVTEGGYVGMDPSSTVYYMSECLLPRDITVLTCGMDIFANLSKQGGVDAVLTGGRLNRKTNNLSGPEVIAMINRFRFDVVFLSADSYVPGQGFFDTYDDEVLVKRAFMQSSAKSVMLLDTSKIGLRGGSKVCDASQVDWLVTDVPDHELLRRDFEGTLL
jgi:DeoR/GlpR family transcriptional regulator of sugar metabolism